MGNNFSSHDKKKLSSFVLNIVPSGCGVLKIILSPSWKPPTASCFRAVTLLQSNFKFSKICAPKKGLHLPREYIYTAPFVEIKVPFGISSSFEKINSLNSSAVTISSPSG